MMSWRIKNYCKAWTSHVLSHCLTSQSPTVRHVPSRGRRAHIGLAGPPTAAAQLGVLKEIKHPKTTASAASSC